MAKRKKRKDKLVAGFLALLTAFSPVASVAPVYAADMNDTGSSSVTMKSESITIDGTESGSIVLDNSSDGSDGITIADDNENNESEGSIFIDGDNQEDGDNIQIDNSDDGINIDEPDGIDIQESDPDGISIDNPDDGINISNPDEDIKITKVGDGIIIESTDENGDKTFTLDPWGGETPENAVNVPTMYELSIDIRSIHGVVKMTPAGADEPRLDKTKYIRVMESDNGYNTVVTDGNGKIIFESPYDELYGFIWSEFISPDTSYTIEAIADDGYVVTDYSIASPRNLDEITDINNFKSGVSSYSWNVGNLNHDRAVIVNFGSSDGIEVSDIKESFDLPDTSDALASVEMTDGSVIEDSENSGENESENTETVLLESEKDTLGYENIEILPDMTSDVEIPEITNADCKEAMFDPVYEKYIKDNINPDYVNFQNLIPAGNMIVKQTFFDGKLLNGRTTIDEIMFSNEEDKLQTMVGQMDTMISVYDVGDSKYYVAYVDTMHNDSRSYVTDHEFAYNNLYGQVLDDCIYDYDTGIAYINKDYFLDENGNFTLNHVQVQLGQVINYNPQYTESVVLDGTSDEVNVDSFDIFVGECTIYVDKGLDPGHMNVWMNGGPCLYDYEYDPADGSLTLQVSSALVSSVYVEDTRSVGQAVLNAIFPFTVVKAAAGLDTPGAHVDPDDMANLDQVVLKKGITDVEVGDGGKETGTYTYYSPGYKNYANSGYPYKCYCFQWGSIGNDPVSRSWADWIKTGGNDKPNLTIQENIGQGLFFSLKMDTLTSKNLPFKWDNLLSGYDSLVLPLQCTHVGQHATGVNSTTHLTRKGNVWCRVIKRWKKTPGAKKTYFLLGVMTGTMNTQTGLGLVKLCYTEEDEPAKLKLQVHKVFNNTFGSFDAGVYDEDAEDAEENAAYDLTSSLFGIYKTKEQAKNAPVIDTMDKSKKDLDKVGENGLLKILKVKNDEGFTGTWKLHKESINDPVWLDNDDNEIPNKVFVVELKAGNGYSLPSLSNLSQWTDGTWDNNLTLTGENRVIPINLDDYYQHFNGIGEDTCTLQYVNTPLYDPMALTIFKTTNPDPKITEISEWKTKCSDPAMNGAKFKLEYWNVDLSKYDKDINVAKDMVVNGYTDDIGEPDENDPVTGASRYNEVPPRKPDHEVELQTIHSDKYGDGYLSIQNDNCFVSGEWKWKMTAGTQSVMPLGLYRLTEIEAPKGYQLPNQTEFFGYCEQTASKDWMGNNRFNGKFAWLDTGTDIISVSQMSINYGGGNSYFSHEFSPTIFDEPSPFINIGTLKIDKDTGKPGKPDNNALSLAGIEFGIWYAPDETEEIINPVTGKKVKPGEQIEGVVLTTDENGCADTTGLNIKDDNDFGVLTPGHKYIIKETKSNDSFFLNKSEFSFEIPHDISKDLYSDDVSAICFFPAKDGSVSADKNIRSAKDAYKDYSENKNNPEKWKLDYNKLVLFENEPPRIGVGVSKFDLMRDSQKLGPNGKANHGNATLEGHTYVVLNGTKSEVRLNDKKTPDGKGTKIKSIWEHGDHLKNPYAPTYKELYHYAEESDFQVKEDGSGYICAILKTDKDGNAETAPDLLPMGVYYVIEVDTKVTSEGYHDYLVNTLDVGHVGEYEPGPEETDEDGKKKDTDKYVLKRDGKEVGAGEMSPDGEVFQAEFTELLKEELYPNEDKSLADKKQPADMPPRGGVEFQKYNYYSDDPYATGDSDLSGFEFTIINVSDDVVKNKDGEEIKTWKYNGYNGKDQFTSLHYKDVKEHMSPYIVQKVVTELVDDPDNKYGAGGKVNMGRTGNQDLPFGDYLIIETKVPEGSGYKLNQSWIGYFEIREDEKMVQIQSVTGDDHNMDAERWRGYNGLPMKYAKDAVACRNKPVSMGIAIEKLDYEMKKPIAQGVASLKGATYAVINASDHKIATKDGRQVSTIQDLSDYSNDAVSFKYLYDIYKNDTRYARDGGHIVTTLTTDKRGFASTARDALPAGTYYVIEVKASPGYWIDENFVGKVCVRDDNICMAMTDKNNPTANSSYFVNVNYVHGYDGENMVDGGGYQPTNKNSYVYEPISYYSRLVLENSHPLTCKHDEFDYFLKPACRLF